MRLLTFICLQIADGEATPSDLTYKVSASSPTVSDTCTAAKDPWPKVYDNTISSLTAAELARRIAQYREMPLSMRYPGTEWADIKVSHRNTTFLLDLWENYICVFFFVDNLVWVWLRVAVIPGSTVGRHDGGYSYIPPGGAAESNYYRHRTCARWRRLENF